MKKMDGDKEVDGHKKSQLNASLLWSTNKASYFKLCIVFNYGYADEILNLILRS